MRMQSAESAAMFTPLPLSRDGEPAIKFHPAIAYSTDATSAGFILRVWRGVGTEYLYSLATNKAHAAMTPLQVRWVLNPLRGPSKDVLLDWRRVPAGPGIAN